MKSYKKKVLIFIQRPWLSLGFVAGSIALLVWMMNITPTAMVPSEDTGTIMGVVTMPPGTSQDRTEAYLNKVDSLVRSCPAVEISTIVSGYSFIGGQGPSYGSFIIKLKDWEERSMKESSTVIFANLYLRSRDVFKDAQVLFFQPPMISGYGVTNGFTFNLQDRTGGDLNKFYQVAQTFLADLQKRPEIESAQTTFNTNFPQYTIDIDAAKCKRAGLSPRDILTTLQGYYGGLYASNFNRFGKIYRVMIQGEQADRANLESLYKIKVRNGSEMAPITEFMTVTPTYGPDNINRFNMYTSMSVMVTLQRDILRVRLLRLLKRWLKRVCLRVIRLSSRVRLVRNSRIQVAPQVSCLCFASCLSTCCLLPSTKVTCCLSPCCFLCPSVWLAHSSLFRV